MWLNLATSSSWSLLITAIVRFEPLTTFTLKPAGYVEQTGPRVHWLQPTEMVSHKHANEEKHAGRLSLGLTQLKADWPDLSANQHRDCVHVTWFSNQLSMYFWRILPLTVRCYYLSFHVFPATRSPGSPPLFLPRPTHRCLQVLLALSENEPMMFLGWPGWQRRCTPCWVGAM